MRRRRVPKLGFSFSRFLLPFASVLVFVEISKLKSNETPDTSAPHFQKRVISLLMAMFGSNAPTEVGLRLLLCPLGSNVLTRTACCSVGIVLPVYSTFKAIESRDQNDQQKWLLYWAAYGSFSIVEIFTDKFLYWFPLYYQVKFAFLVWLQLPSADGARKLYAHHLRPFLVKHQARFDQVVGLLYTEMAKFVSTHQAEFQLAKTILTRTLVAVCDVVNPGHRQVDGAIEGPSAVDETSESDVE